MNYLITNPACPYCYANVMMMEKELKNLDDNDLYLLPYTLTPDVQEYDDKLYQTTKDNFENNVLEELSKYDIKQPKFYLKENIGSSKLVFMTYYYLREYNLGLKFYHEITKLFYLDDFNYSNINNLTNIIEKLGLNKDDYLNKINNYEAIYLDELNKVDDYEIESVPAYIIDNEIYYGINKPINILKNK
ncbi:MAG: hypothetical protein LBR40_02630 [Bacilli bacterium]|jgi:predicted DsbA family dithiol-disulfide isomerase|nr:hypothetical protein [Bacilli bacterium]